MRPGFQQPGFQQPGFQQPRVPATSRLAFGRGCGRTVGPGSSGTSFAGDVSHQERLAPGTSRAGNVLSRGHLAPGTSCIHAAPVSWVVRPRIWGKVTGSARRRFRKTVQLKRWHIGFRSVRAVVRASHVPGPTPVGTRGMGARVLVVRYLRIRSHRCRPSPWNGVPTFHATVPWAY